MSAIGNAISWRSGGRAGAGSTLLNGTTALPMVVEGGACDVSYNAREEHAKLSKNPKPTLTMTTTNGNTNTNSSTAVPNPGLSLELKGKIAFVTGGGRGIGLAITQQLAKGRLRPRLSGGARR